MDAIYEYSITGVRRSLTSSGQRQRRRRLHSSVVFGLHLRKTMQAIVDWPNLARKASGENIGEKKKWTGGHSLMTLDITFPLGE